MRFSDIHLQHTSWQNLERITKELKIFSRNIDVFILALSIGIAEDKVEVDDLKEDVNQIGRNTLNENDDVNSLMEFLYRNAVLNTKTLNLDDETRKKSAFDNEEFIPPFSVNKFLIEFANYGMVKISEKLVNDPLTCLDNIKELFDYYINNSISIDIDEIEGF